MAKKQAKRAERTKPRARDMGMQFEQKKFDPLGLLLDSSNPRLPPGDRGKGQEHLIEVMLERFAIDEIAESICSAGFLPLDPFIGHSEGAETRILEGNRRLATIKLLLQADLTPPRYSKTWDAYRKRVSQDSIKKMQKIPVSVYGDRRDANVLAYVGYRHVNGVLSWEAEEKAAFIAQLLEDKSIRWSYSDIASKIGSKPAYVEKLYVAHRLAEQAKDRDVPGASDMRSSFGVLTRALQSPGVQRFLGIEFPHDPKKSRRPFKKPKRDLEDFVRWTFGTKDAKPVLEDSRDLTRWGQILDSKDAVRYLRTAKDPRFDRAYAKSGGLKEGLVDALMGASDRLQESVPLVRGHKQDDDVRSSVEKCTDYLVQILRHFPEIAKRQGLELHDASAS